MRIVIVGGAGFIGSNLCAHFIAGGHSVVCFDNFATGSSENVEELMGHDRFELVELDVKSGLPDIGCDIVFNLACPASPIHYQRDPIDTLLTNVVGARNVLEFARAADATVVHASTSEVYGDPLVHPQPEGYWGNVSSIGPRACYDEGKRAAETLCFDYRRVHGVDVKVARIFNTYGPHMAIDDGRVIGNFIVQALRGEPLTVYGTGGQTRSFCYIDDLVEALDLLARSPRDVSGPVNLGAPSEITVLELTERVRSLTGADVPVRFEPLPVDDPTRRKPDIRLARSLLGWQPHTSLDDGIRQTMAFFAERVGRK